MSIEHQAHLEPVDPPLKQRDKVLPQLQNPESQTSNSVLHQTAEDVMPPTNDNAKTPPHQRLAEQKMDAAAEKQNTEGEAPIRQKERTILRQTDSGLVVVGEQGDVDIQQGVKSGSRQQDDEGPQSKAHEPAPSSTADWQSYATPSSGFQVGRAWYARKTS